MTVRTQYKQLTAEDFMRKILEGERDFRKSHIPNPDLTADAELYGKLQTYLRDRYDELKKNPIYLCDSILVGLKASEIFLPYVIGIGANLENANLRNANLEYADLRNVNLLNANLWYANLLNANLWYADLLNADLEYANLRNANLLNADLRNAILWCANLENANLENAILWYVDLENANLENADLENADLWHANLEYADLRRVKNLDKAKNLEHASYFSTKVTEREKKIIEKALKKKKLFER
jgi:uncharacterized protein YjbI with pentapeptide repeats